MHFLKNHRGVKLNTYTFTFHKTSLLLLVFKIVGSLQCPNKKNMYFSSKEHGTIIFPLPIITFSISIRSVLQLFIFQTWYLNIIVSFSFLFQKSIWFPCECLFWTDWTRLIFQKHLTLKSECQKRYFFCIIICLLFLQQVSSECTEAAVRGCFSK